MLSELIANAQELINALEGQEVRYLGTSCKVENGVLYDLEQETPNNIDLNAMSESELENLIDELASPRLTLEEWEEKMMEETEGTVIVSCVMESVPYHPGTKRYQVYNEEGTYDELFDVTLDDDGNVIDVE